MKRSILLLLALVFSLSTMGQEKLYLVFDMMKVDNEQESDYMEVESFWEKIHEQRMKNGDIIGWDLWRLGPGGENQGFQYMTVNLYDDPVKMMDNSGDFDAALKAAYPDMSDEELEKKFGMTPKARDIAVRIFLERIAGTDDDFEMPLGTVARINMMKVNQGDYSKYEKMETEVFMPMHQQAVENGNLSNWGLLRIMLPTGSDTYASHITVDMFKDMAHMFAPDDDDGPELTDEQMKQINDGIATRDLKYTYLATLIKSVKK